MHSYSVAQAKAQLSSLLDLVERGQPVEITRRGRPVARLSPPLVPSKPFDWDSHRAWVLSLPQSNGDEVRRLRDEDRG
jgi:prevent-host-death family protein